MRTVNDNGPGAESAASNTISVGRPKAPAVQAAGSVTGVKITFTPDTPETGDSWVYWAEDASAGSSSEVRLEEATVSPDVQPRQGEWSGRGAGAQGQQQRLGACLLWCGVHG